MMSSERVKIDWEVVNEYCNTCADVDVKQHVCDRDSQHGTNDSVPVVMTVIENPCTGNQEDHASCELYSTHELKEVREVESQKCHVLR